MSKVSKVTINQDKLEAFSGTLDGAVSLIKLEMHTTCDKAKIRQLLDQLLDAWAYVYDPTVVCINRAMHNLYGLYIRAKKAGNAAKAKAYLECYRDMIAGRQIKKEDYE